MLKNYGYDVIDLGKDVDNQLVIDTADKGECGDHWIVCPYDDDND